MKLNEKQTEILAQQIASALVGQIFARLDRAARALKATAVREKAAQNLGEFVRTGKPAKGSAQAKYPATKAEPEANLAAIKAVAAGKRTLKMLNKASAAREKKFNPGITKRDRAAFERIAKRTAVAENAPKKRGARDMSCRIPGCKERSLGPRFRYFCRSHNDTMSEANKKIALQVYAEIQKAKA